MSPASQPESPVPSPSIQSAVPHSRQQAQIQASCYGPVPSAITCLGSLLVDSEARCSVHLCPADSGPDPCNAFKLPASAAPYFPPVSQPFPPLQAEGAKGGGGTNQRSPCGHLPLLSMAVRAAGATIANQQPPCSPRPARLRICLAPAGSWC